MTENSSSFKALQGSHRHRSCFVGCGLGLLGVVICIIGVVWLGMYLLKKSVAKEIVALESQGFTLFDKNETEGEAGASGGFSSLDLLTRQLIVKESLPDKTLLVGQHVWVNGNAEGDLAIVAQEAEINGIVKGTLYFRGQVLTIGEHGVVEKDLDATAQLVTIMGDVKGGISGVQQELLDQRQAGASLEMPDKVEEPMEVKDPCVEFEPTEQGLDD